MQLLGSPPPLRSGPRPSRPQSWRPTGAPLTVRVSAHPGDGRWREQHQVLTTRSIVARWSSRPSSAAADTAQMGRLTAGSSALSSIRVGSGKNVRVSHQKECACEGIVGCDRKRLQLDNRFLSRTMDCRALSSTPYHRDQALAACSPQFPPPRLLTPCLMRGMASVQVITAEECMTWWISR